MNTAVQGVGARGPSILIEMGRRTNQPKRLLPHGGGTRFQRTDKSAIRDFRRGCQMRLQHDAMPHARKVERHMRAVKQRAFQRFSRGGAEP